MCSNTPDTPSHMEKASDGSPLILVQDVSVSYLDEGCDVSAKFTGFYDRPQRTNVTRFRRAPSARSTFEGVLGTGRDRMAKCKVGRPSPRSTPAPIDRQTPLLRSPPLGSQIRYLSLSDPRRDFHSDLELSEERAEWASMSVRRNNERRRRRSNA